MSTDDVKITHSDDDCDIDTSINTTIDTTVNVYSLDNLDDSSTPGGYKPIFANRNSDEDKCFHHALAAMHKVEPEDIKVEYDCAHRIYTINGVRIFRD